jgi:hypothetical protein
LGFLELVKVIGTSTSTELNSIAADQTVVLNSQFITPDKELEGIFGLHDLGRLNTILSIPEYKENSFIQVIKTNDIPVGISFQNANRDFRNDYRFMSKEVIETQIPTKIRKSINWDVSFVPSINNIQRLKFQSQAAGSSEGTFNAKVDKNNLYFSIGDHSTHTGEFVFSAGVSGKLNTPRDWPLSHVQGILNLTGDKVMKISDAGAMQITVTSGLAVHQYTILSSMK